MAGILHNVFSKGIYSLKDPDNVSKIKTLVNHSALYFGLSVCKWNIIEQHGANNYSGWVGGPAGGWCLADFALSFFHMRRHLGFLQANGVCSHRGQNKGRSVSTFYPQINE